MCTSHGPDEVIVCDVALPDVRRIVGTLAGVALTHLPYEGTRVANSGETATVAFRAALVEAITPHGGALTG